MTKPQFLFGIILTLSTAVASCQTFPASSAPADSAALSATNRFLGAGSTNALPPLPTDVTELKFDEFFRQPIGPRGLEYNDKLRRLDGRRIRILGYMVRQEKPAAGGFMLAPRPISVHEEEFGLCDDLPAALLHVSVDAKSPKDVPYTPGLLLLTGRLSVGNRTETNGRISTVRLELDPPTPEQQLAAARTIEAEKHQESSRPDPDAGHQH